MSSKILLPCFAILLWSASMIHAQNPAQPQNTEDSPRANRFWQATLPGGHYMVALDRISSVSRHRYLLDGALIVDEVTIDALGQSLARFYHITPVTDAAGGSGVGAAASRVTGRGSQLLDKAANIAGTGIHEMVVKKFPETTHAKTIEYRLLSAEELSGLHDSVRTAWESGRGRKFTVK
jgi:hypothetical protein